MSVCPGCGREINDSSSWNSQRGTHYNGGYWHVNCAERDRERQQRSLDAQEQLAKERLLEQQKATEAAQRSEQIARETLLEQQQARYSAERAEEHAREQKELAKDSVLYQNSLNSANDGDVDSMVFVAKKILEGQVVVRSISLAKKWLFKAFKENSLEALQTIYTIWYDLNNEEKQMIVSSGRKIIETSLYSDDYINFFEMLSDAGDTQARIDFVNAHPFEISAVDFCPYCYKMIKPFQMTWHDSLIKENLPTIRNFCSQECSDKYYTETPTGKAEYEEAKKIQFEKDHSKCEICGNYYLKGKGSFNKLVTSNLDVKHYFCSDKCRDKFYETESGQEEFKKAEEIQFHKDHSKCENCGNYYLKKDSVENEQVAQLLGKHHNLCSQKCIDDFYSTKEEGLAELKEIKAHTHECAICKKSYYDANDSKFCSDDCKKRHAKRRNIKVFIAVLIIMIPSIVYLTGVYTYEGNVIYNYVISTINAKRANIIQGFDLTFETRSSIESITIPEGVTSIGEKAFYGCSSLREVIIPTSVTFIDDSAFNGCTSIKSVNADPKWSSLFAELVIKEWIIPEGVTSIGERAFYGCRYLKSITIPNSVISIGNYAFSNCSSLTEINIPDSVTSIGYRAFSNCSSLTEINIPDSVSSIADSAFSGCTSLTSITISDCVTSLSAGTFSGCSSLTSITIPNNVISIGYCAFSNCSSLTEINIPDSVTSIADSAFEYCSSLTEITIPDSVTSIGYKAFYSCSSLESIYIERANETGMSLKTSWKPTRTTVNWIGNL